MKLVIVFFTSGGNVIVCGRSVLAAEEDVQGKRGVVHKVELCVNGVGRRGCRLRPLHRRERDRMGRQIVPDRRGRGRRAQAQLEESPSPEAHALPGLLLLQPPLLACL